MSQLWYHMTLRRQYRGDTPLYIDREWGNREASEGIEVEEEELRYYCRIIRYLFQHEQCSRII